MKFPWDKYEEIPIERRNTLQVFITNRCNLSCLGCFARKIMFGPEKDISVDEYEKVVHAFIDKKGIQINLLGGEPLLHPDLKQILTMNRFGGIKTTIYTNGLLLDKYFSEDFDSVKLRVSVYSYDGKNKSIKSIKTNFSIDINYMISKETTMDDLLQASNYSEHELNCKVFFISSIRELDNENKEFFEDTDLTMPLFEYKSLVHNFLNEYNGNMDIHISKRGVFESTVSPCYNKCSFANYFIGGKIIQCPYDVVNLKYQNDYEFNIRYCQNNSTCLMSKVIYRKREKHDIGN